MGEFVQRVDVITARAGQRAGACECHVFVAGKDFQFINTGFSGAGLLDCESHEPGLNRFESFHVVTDIYRLPRRLFLLGQKLRQAKFQPGNLVLG